MVSLLPPLVRARALHGRTLLLLLPLPWVATSPRCSPALSRRLSHALPLVRLLHRYPSPPLPEAPCLRRAVLRMTLWSPLLSCCRRQALRGPPRTHRSLPLTRVPLHSFCARPLPLLPPHHSLHSPPLRAANHSTSHSTQHIPHHPIPHSRPSLLPATSRRAQYLSPHNPFLPRLTQPVTTLQTVTTRRPDNPCRSPRRRGRPSLPCNTPTPPPTCHVSGVRCTMGT